MKTKFEKFIDAFSIFFAIALFVIVLALCVFGIKLSLEQLDNKCVAYADSTDGVVNDNLFEYNDFSEQGYWTPSFFDTYSFSSQGFVFSHTNWSVLEYKHDFIELDTTYTLSININGLLSVRTFTTPSSVSSNNNYCIQNYSSGLSFRLYYPSIDDAFLIPTFDFSSGVFPSGTFYWIKIEKGSTRTDYVPKDYTNYGYNQGLEEGYNNGLSHGVLSFGFNSADNLSVDLSSLYSRGSYSGAYPNGIFNFDGIPYGYHGLYHYLISTDPVVQMDCYSSYGSPVNGLYPSVGFKYVSNYDIEGDILINMPWVSVNGSLTSIIQPVQVAFFGRDTGSVLYVSQLDSLHWFNAGYLYSFDATVVGTTPVQYNVYLITISVHFDEPVDIYFLPQYYNNSVNDQYMFMPSIDSRFGVFYQSTTSSIYGVNSNVVDRNNLESYNSGYNNGYDLGFNDGVDSVNTQSYYNNGYNMGYDAGHRDGVVENTDYSFLGLIGAVFDAPIQAFGGLLDFNLLGVNLKSFVLAMLSLSVIIIILKIALGGS